MLNTANTKASDRTWSWGSPVWTYFIAIHFQTYPIYFSNEYYPRAYHIKILCGFVLLS